MKYRYLLKHKKFKFAAILSLIISAFSISLMYKESYTNKIEFNHNIIVNVLAAVPIMIIGIIFSNYTRAIKLRYGIVKRGKNLNVTFMYIAAYLYLIIGITKELVYLEYIDEKYLKYIRPLLILFILCICTSIIYTKLIIRKCKKRIQCNMFEKNELCYERSCINCICIRSLKGDNFKERLKIELVKNHAEYSETLESKKFYKIRRQAFAKGKIKYGELIKELKSLFEGKYINETFEDFFFDIDVKSNSPK